MTTDIIVAQKFEPYTIPPDAVADRDALVVRANEVTAVSNPQEQMFAVEIARTISGRLKDIEDVRKRVKQPILDHGRAIDDVVKTHIAPLGLQLARLEKMVSSFQAKERARVAEEEKQRQEAIRLALIEEQKAKAEADAALKAAQNKDPDEEEQWLLAREQARMAEDNLRAAQEQSSDLVRSELPVAVKEHGMAVADKVCWEITDPKKVYAHWPHFFKLEPQKRIINDTVHAGFVCDGMKIWTEVQTKFRS